ncbi:MAG TPA: phosphopantetheine-binding protein, partial [Thermoanaerobaculia bacterium]|nr:phosphopantetheine-binding protein [Thermoanaerobaculia bacterium]
VRAAAVLAFPTETGELGELRLVAYVAAVGERVPEGSNLRSHLERRLPAYMVPSAFKVRAELPCTSSGKIDRSALAGLGDPFAEREGGAMPETPLDKVLAGMIAEVLGLQGGVGLHDNFFELGGHSMRAVELVARLRDAFGIDVPLFHVFDAPTVKELAAVLMGAPEWGPIVEELAPALLQLIEPPAEPMGASGQEEKR